MISFNDFTKIKLITAKILEAEPHGNKLMKLKVKADKERTILAGIQDHYSPEELVNKIIVIVANLEPKRLAGEMSEGMLLAAENEGRIILLTTDKEIPENSEIH
jgi:methionyl-tRNA synthetase